MTLLNSVEKNLIAISILKVSTDAQYQLSCALGSSIYHWVKGYLFKKDLPNPLVGLVFYISHYNSVSCV